jgi:hypothetical protein
LFQIRPLTVFSVKVPSFASKTSKLSPAVPSTTTVFHAPAANPNAVRAMINQVIASMVTRIAKMNLLAANLMPDYFQWKHNLGPQAATV